MNRITFRFFDEKQDAGLLPRMYDILYANMRKIFPMTSQYDQDKKTWLDWMASDAARGHEIILMYVEKTLAGYFQFRTEGDTLLIEEIEILPEYQRTLLFARFMQYAGHFLPQQIQWLEAYIRKENDASQALAEGLGLRVVGENKKGTSWKYRGDIAPLRKYLSHGGAGEG